MSTIIIVISSIYQLDIIIENIIINKNEFVTGKKTIKPNSYFGINRNKKNIP